MYKYELHCHSNPVSACSRFPVKELVKAYIDAGYDGIVLTNHINQQTFMNQRTSRWPDLIEYFLKDYKDALKYAGDRLQVLLGAEVHFYENNNDYLIYGDIEDFILKHPTMMHYGIKKFSELAREAGILLIQAHPFRNGMSIVNPKLLDGVEIHNGHPRHHSRNDIASLWQERYHLLYSAGSDAHERGDISSGILTEVEIKDNITLLEVLKTGNFDIIK